MSSRKNADFELWKLDIVERMTYTTDDSEVDISSSAKTGESSANNIGSDDVGERVGTKKVSWECWESEGLPYDDSDHGGGDSFFFGHCGVERGKEGERSLGEDGDDHQPHKKRFHYSRSKLS